MPYITPTNLEVHDRQWLLDRLAAAEAMTRELVEFKSGGLNFLLTSIVASWLTHEGLSYQTCNDIVGALDNAKDEFRRRVQHPYEDRKEDLSELYYHSELGLRVKPRSV